MMIGKETGVYTEDLIMPILTCLSDADSRVRYYACESLYNVVKVRSFARVTLEIIACLVRCQGRVSYQCSMRFLVQ